MTGEYHHGLEADEDFLNKTKINTANWTSLKSCVLQMKIKLQSRKDILNAHVQRTQLKNTFFLKRKKKKHSKSPRKKTTQFLR